MFISSIILMAIDSFLNHHSLLHVGEFGIVYRGHIIKDKGTGQIVTDTVAVKTLKGIDLCPVYTLRITE